VSGYTAAEGGSEQTVGYEHNQHSHSEGNYYSQHPSALTLMQFTPSHRAKEWGTEVNWPDQDKTAFPACKSWTFY